MEICWINLLCSFRNLLKFYTRSRTKHVSSCFLTENGMKMKGETSRMKGYTKDFLNLLYPLGFRVLIIVLHICFSNIEYN